MFSLSIFHIRGILQERGIKDMNLTVSKPNIGKRQLIFTAVLLGFLTGLLTISPAFAAEVPPELTSILGTLLEYIGIIFRGIGILLAIYAFGQMILAFKDENPDAKSKSASILVVGILLIAMPTIIEALDLVEYLS